MTPDLHMICTALRDAPLEAVAQELGVSVSWLKMVIETDGFGAIPDETPPRAPK